MPRQPATGPRAPQMHRSTNRKGEDCVIFYFCRISCALPAVELAGEEQRFGKTGGGVKGVRDLQSPNKVAGLYTQADEPLFAPSPPRWTVSVRPSYNRAPTEWPTPFGFLPFNCLSVQSPRQYFAFDAVGTEQSQRVDWSGPTQLGNT